MDLDFSRLRLDGGSTAGSNNSHTGRRSQGSRAPWLAGSELDPDTSSPSELLDEEVRLWYDYVRPTASEHQLRLQVFACFEKVVDAVWPGAQAELFGSMATGLYLPHGDFDVKVYQPGTRLRPTPANLRRLPSAVRDSGFAKSSSIQLILSARVPLCKFTSAASFGSFRFDVSFDGEGSDGPRGAAESNRLLRSLDAGRRGDAERAKRLILFTKAFLESHNLNEVRLGGLGGMSIFALGVHFVQQDVRPLRECTPGEDLVEFCRYYGSTFNVAQHAISLTDGLISRSSRPHLAVRTQAFRQRISIQHPVTSNRDLSSSGSRFPAIRMRLEEVYIGLFNYFRCSTSPESALVGLRLGLSSTVVKKRTANLQLAKGGTVDRLAKYWSPEV